MTAGSEVHAHGDAPPSCDDPVAISGSDGYLAWKRGLDCTIALLLLVATGPLVLMLMALVKLTSRGPALYSQIRLGLDGRPFSIYKIRTMVHDYERIYGPRWTAEGDPGILPLGRFLRRTHLDELPQLWNVLQGEMSLVGPRPERPVFVDKLELALPRYRERLVVRPGVTGLAQVRLPADVDLEGVRRKLLYDLYYIRHASLRMDMQLLMVTALGLAGVPYARSCRALRVPRAEAIEGNGAGYPEGVDKTVQIQPA